MKTIQIADIDACRMDIIRAAMQTDSLDVLNKMRHAYRRAAAAAAKNTEVQPYAPIPGVPNTLEEVKQDIAEFEAALDAGTLETVSPEDANAWIRKELPWLCKGRAPSTRHARRQ